MKVGIVGLGYVGIVTAAVLADQGHKVVGVDIDKSKVDILSGGRRVIFEPGLDEILAKATVNLKFSTSYGKLQNVDAVMVCVATPNLSGRINLDYVFAAMKSLKDNNVSAPVAIKSTVVPGTASKIFEETGRRVVSNPEFLREGSGIEDTIHPDRVVIGGVDESSIETFAHLWSFTQAPILKTTNENAELIKYASNAFLATKISFINEIANLCEVIPTADVKTVSQGMGYDKRIAPFFLQAGLGFGGSCFPKDTKAIASFARDRGVRLNIVEAAMQVNGQRVETALDRIEGNYGTLKDKKICVLGLSFKDNTDDVRESKSWELIREIERRGGIVTAYDPIIKKFEEIEVVSSPEECVRSSDFCIVSTEWKEFNEIDFPGDSKVIDLRGVLGKGKSQLTVGKHAEN